MRWFGRVLRRDAGHIGAAGDTKTRGNVDVWSQQLDSDPAAGVCLRQRTGETWRHAVPVFLFRRKQSGYFKSELLTDEKLFIF